MRNLRLAWQLLRLVRRMERDSKGRDVGAMLMLTVEGGAGYEQRAAAAAEAGHAPAARRRAYEMSYWPVLGEPAATRRGTTMAEALALALSDR